MEETHDDALSRWTRFKWWADDLIPYELQRFWYEQVSSRIWPRQAWLTRQVPRTYAESDQLIEDLLYAILIGFVETEKGLDGAWTDRGVQKAQLREAYEWAKTGRAAFRVRIRAAYPTLDLDAWLNGACYDCREAFQLEEEFAAIDTRHLTTIVALRQHLWT